MAHREEISFCRICMGSCGVIVTLDDDGRLADIRADRNDPQTLGFACIKGLRAVEAHNKPDRILRPLKRVADGWETIELEQALDEIAARLSAIRDEYGPEAIAGYKGGGGFFTSSAVLMLNDWLRGLGSPKTFSSASIDQSAKAVAAGRLGIWPAGKTPVHRCDALLLVGTNPLVSVNPPFDVRNPVKRMKEAKARGMKLIIIDPRETETARFADIFVQPLPGEDPTIIASVIHIILDQQWHDADFCRAHVEGLEDLRDAVAPFTPAYAAHRADVPEEQLWEVARTFARDSRRSLAGSSTAPDMGPHSNLAEHLIEVLNVICGNYLREGDQLDNPGVITARYPRRAQVLPAPRWWETGPRSRVDGSGMLNDEMMTGVMADEILTPGEGQVRALFVQGGNPASAVPDQRKIVKALRSLDLLVCLEPTMTVTAQLADYVLPPKLQYERPDLPFFLYENMIYSEDPYTRYTPAIAAPPPGSQLVDDAYVFWSLAKRMGTDIEHFGVKLDMARPPEVDELLAIAARHAPVAFDELRQHPRGMLCAGEPQFVEPAEPGWEGRFSVIPPDVREELDSVRAEAAPDAGGFTHRLAVRRLREVFNSVGRDLPSIRKKVRFNRAFINPADLDRLGILSGDELEISSAHGAIVAAAEADATVRSGVVSISHGFGGLPDEISNRGYYDDGVSTNLLLSDAERETINAMPRMTGIPVAIRPVAARRTG